MIATAMLATVVDTYAFDEAKYPEVERGLPRYDPSKPDGRGQQAPLNPEYQAFHEACVADRAAVGSIIAGHPIRIACSCCGGEDANHQTK